MNRLVHKQSRSLTCSGCKKLLHFIGVVDDYVVFACRRRSDEEVDSKHAIVLVDAKQFDMDDLQDREDDLPF